MAGGLCRAPPWPKPPRNADHTVPLACNGRLVLHNMETGVQQAIECYSNIWTLAWAPLNAEVVSKTIAVGTGSGMILYFVLEGAGTYAPVWKDGGTLRAHENVVASLAFHPDGGFLLSGSLDNTVRLWCGPLKVTL